MRSKANFVQDGCATEKSRHQDSLWFFFPSHFETPGLPAKIKMAPDPINLLCLTFFSSHFFR